MTIDPERLIDILAEAAVLHPHIARRIQFVVVVETNGDVPGAACEWLDTLLDQTASLTSHDVAQLAAELDTLRLAIVGDVAKVNPHEAINLLWRFFTLAENIFNRTGDEGCDMSEVFDRVCADVVAHSIRAEIPPQTFASQIHASLAKNGYGEFRNLVHSIDAEQRHHPTYIGKLKACALLP